MWYIIVTGNKKHTLRRKWRWTKPKWPHQYDERKQRGAQGSRKNDGLQVWRHDRWAETACRYLFGGFWWSVEPWLSGKCIRAKKPLNVQDAECGWPLRDTAEGKAQTQGKLRIFALLAALRCSPLTNVRLASIPKTGTGRKTEFAMLAVAILGYLGRSTMRGY